jgi:hypothetical protein
MQGEKSIPTNKRPRRKRAETLLIFDPAQKVPGPVLDAILEDWLVPSLVEQFLRERGFTQCRLPLQAADVSHTIFLGTACCAGLNFRIAVLNRPMSLNRMSEVRSGVFRFQKTSRTRGRRVIM